MLLARLAISSRISLFLLRLHLLPFLFYIESRIAIPSIHIDTAHSLIIRLLKCEADGRLTITKDIYKDIPPYAILSHTWGGDDDEVTFADITNNRGKDKAGYRKIEFCGKQAAADGLLYFWVDTCCIDKSSSAELQEAINCMFRWYKDSNKCYVYLPDVSRLGSGGGSSAGWSALAVQSLFPPSSFIAPSSFPETWETAWLPAFRKSRWFTRGWTLQELIAPASVEFFSKEGIRLGDKRSLEEHIQAIAGIPAQIIRGHSVSDCSVPERMAWIEHRETSRQEDKAYSLLGIFDVHIPMLYGEGRERAFQRLWKEVNWSPHELSETKGSTPKWITGSVYLPRLHALS